MTYLETLQWGRATLASAGIDEHYLESEVLLCHAIGKNRAELYARLSDRLPDDRAEAYKRLVKRRLTREPLAYITRRKEFFGLDFAVDARVLIPRPETEMLVERAVGAVRERFGGDGRRAVLADIGTGSGCVAIALAVHLPAARVYATDASAGALAVAERNVRRHGVARRVTLLRGDLAEPLPEPVDMLVANLPYVLDGDYPGLAPELHHEPREALLGGPDGTDAIARLLRSAPTKVKLDGMLLLEVNETHAETVAEMARAAFPEATVRVWPDLAGLPRVVEVRRTEAHKPS